MLCFRPVFSVVLVCGSVACGFQPLYAPSSGTPGPATTGEVAAPSPVAALGSVSVDRIADREGQQLRTQLTRLLGSGSEAERYRLDVNIKTESESLALRRTGLATRSSLRMSANYRLIDVKTDQVVLKSAARGISSYNLLDQDFSTLASLQDAQRRLIEQMALDIRNRLAVFFVAGPMPGDVPSPATPAAPPAPDAVDAPESPADSEAPAEAAAPL